MNVRDELYEAYSFLRDPIIKKAIDRIDELEAALLDIKCDCTTLCAATEHPEAPGKDCIHFSARIALGEKKDG